MVFMKAFGDKRCVVVDSHISNVQQFAAELRERSFLESAAIVAPVVAILRRGALALPAAAIVVIS